VARTCVGTFIFFVGMWVDCLTFLVRALVHYTLVGNGCSLPTCRVLVGIGLGLEFVLSPKDPAGCLDITPRPAFLSLLSFFLREGLHCVINAVLTVCYCAEQCS
jgi:hypothetical protein